MTNQKLTPEEMEQQKALGMAFARNILVAIKIVEDTPTPILEDIYHNAINQVNPSTENIQTRKKLKELIKFSKGLDRVNNIKHSPVLSTDGKPIQRPIRVEEPGPSRIITPDHLRSVRHG